MDTRAPHHRRNVTIGSVALVTVTLLASIASVGAAFLMGRAVGRDDQLAGLARSEEVRSGPGESAASPRWDGGALVIVYLDLDISDEERQALRASLGEDPAIERFGYVDHAAAYEELRRLLAHSPGLVAATEPEELTTSFELVPEEPTPESVQRIEDTYADEPGVRKVAISH
jgi:hypothetical protein